MISATSSNIRRSFRSRLLDWYDGNRRQLPWRETNDPYRVWVSEIMLQQTRVAAVLDHYRRFLERFPAVQTLARAREQSVLAAWSGLGYYRRARMMHACAKAVVAEHEGKFPDTVGGLLQLPGIGRYTAGAIASIAFGQKAPVVDGNVERVLARITGDAQLSDAECWRLAESLISDIRPGDFNQAIMELGATVCLPKDPKCLVCPVIDLCRTRGPLPVSAKPKQVKKTIALALSQREGSVWLIQRGKHETLMANMWELPEVPINGHRPAATFKHSILSTDFAVSVHLTAEPVGEGKWISRPRLPKTALTGLARKVLRHFGAL